MNVFYFTFSLLFFSQFFSYIADAQIKCSALMSLRGSEVVPELKDLMVDLSHKDLSLLQSAIKSKTKILVGLRSPEETSTADLKLVTIKRIDETESEIQVSLVDESAAKPSHLLVPFSRLEVYGPWREVDLGKPRNYLKKTDQFEPRLSKFAERLKVLDQAFKTQAWVEVIGNPDYLGHEEILGVGKVHTINRDGDYVSVIMTNLNGGPLWKIISPIDYRFQIVTPQTGLTIQKDRAPMPPNVKGTWDVLELPYSQLLSSGSLSESQKQIISNIRTISTIGGLVEWTLGSERVFGYLHRIFLDESYMPIVQITDVTGRYRFSFSSIAVSSVQVVDPKLVKNQKTHEFFLRQNRPLYAVSAEAIKIIRDNMAHASEASGDLKYLEYLRDAMRTGKLVEWRRYASNYRGRVKQIYSDSANEVLVVFSMIGSEDQVHSFSGLLMEDGMPMSSGLSAFVDNWVGSDGLTPMPTVVRVKNKAYSYTADSRIRISRESQRHMEYFSTNGLLNTVELIKIAIINERKVDILSGSNPTKYIRARVLSTDGINIIVDIENVGIQALNFHSISKLSLASGPLPEPPPPPAPKPVVPVVHDRVNKSHEQLLGREEKAALAWIRSLIKEGAAKNVSSDDLQIHSIATYEKTYDSRTWQVVAIMTAPGGGHFQMDLLSIYRTYRSIAKFVPQY